MHLFEEIGLRSSKR